MGNHFKNSGIEHINPNTSYKMVYSFHTKFNCVYCCVWIYVIYMDNVLIMKYISYICNILYPIYVYLYNYILYWSIFDRQSANVFNLKIGTSNNWENKYAGYKRIKKRIISNLEKKFKCQ